MKVLINLIICVFIYSNIYSQNRINIWQTSFGSPTYGLANEINFNSGSADTLGIIRDMNFFLCSAGICDTSGQLLFYTNGQYIGNRNHDTLLNGYNYNPGYATDIFYCSSGFCSGLGLIQPVIILPFPDNADKYYLLHITGEEFPNPYGTTTFLYQPLEFRYSIVDMSLDGGMGGIPVGSKNLTLLTDTLVTGQIAAVKHGNGRDWFIFIQKFNSNFYYKYLLTPAGIQQIPGQYLGLNSPIINDYFGSALFSPDGNKYAHIISIVDTLNLFDFDRCTGMFSNPIYLTVPDTGIYGRILSCSFSPNNRFLYASTHLNLYQFDLLSPNINNSRTTVATYDGFVSPFPTYFFQHALAPDNKIYLSTYGGCNVLHVINSPDSLGVSCDVSQHSFILPTYNNCLPNFTNYDLGKIAGSPCDTIVGINDPNKNGIFTIYPNPSPDKFWINYEIEVNSKADFHLYNSMGINVFYQTLYGTSKTLLISTKRLSAGVYFAKINLDGKSVYVEKLIINK
ncbi:MAG: T9SS type A sorting domain-containing protein [Nitrosopumilus sp.]|nr:T9SS type A sorting domain-containing protein [Nitrosopumilus sp.]